MSKNYTAAYYRASEEVPGPLVSEKIIGSKLFKRQEDIFNKIIFENNCLYA